jgi:hypothetical protein
MRYRYYKSFFLSMFRCGALLEASIPSSDWEENSNLFLDIDLWRCLNFARVSAHNYSRVHRGTSGCKATFHSPSDELQRFVLELRGLLFKLCSDFDTFMELRASPLGPNRPSNRDHLIQSCYIALNNNSRSAVDIFLKMLNVTPPKCSQTYNAS